MFRPTGQPRYLLRIAQATDWDANGKPTRWSARFLPYAFHTKRGMVPAICRLADVTRRQKRKDEYRWDIVTAPTHLSDWREYGPDDLRANKTPHLPLPIGGVDFLATFRVENP